MLSDSSLTNQLLIAMPGMLDPNFSTTVTLVCEHNDDGALGIGEHEAHPGHGRIGLIQGYRKPDYFDTTGGGSRGSTGIFTGGSG